MIESIRIQNFKCLKDTGILTLKPLTFFVGPNSSGKTSIKHFLAMLTQSLETSNNTPLTTKGKLIDVGPYEDFIYKKKLATNLLFEFDYFIYFDKPSAKALEIETKIKSNFQAKLSFDKIRQQIKLDEYYISCKYMFEEVKYDKKTRKYVAQIGYLNDKTQKFEKVRLEVKELNKFNNFYPDLAKISKKNREILVKNKRAPLTSILPDSIRRALNGLFFLGPLRDYPKRFYATTGESYRDVGSKGENTIDILWHDSILNKDKKLIFEKIQFWSNELGIAKSLNIENIKKNYMYSLSLFDNNSQTNVNISDSGFGSSQVLPIITECFFMGRNGTALIEQPEIHLHPKAQSILGDIFIDAIQNNEKRFIVETHSEHVLNRIRRRIAEKKLKKEDVIIYYFDPSKTGSKISEIKLSDLGEYIEYPDGFFEEGFIESYEIIKAMNNRRTKNA